MNGSDEFGGIVVEDVEQDQFGGLAEPEAEELPPLTVPGLPEGATLGRVLRSPYAVPEPAGLKIVTPPPAPSGLPLTPPDLGLARTPSLDLSQLQKQEPPTPIRFKPSEGQFPGIVPSPYDVAEMESARRGLGRPTTGMESGTELTGAVAAAASGEIAATKEMLDRAWNAAKDGTDPLAGFEELTKPFIQSTGAGLQALGEFAWRRMYPTGDVDWEELRKQSPKLMMLPEAYRSLIKTSPQIGAVALLQAAGVPSPVAAGFIFGSTPEGFDPGAAAIAAGIPAAGEAGEALAAKALKSVPVVKVAIEQVGKNADTLRGKVIQGIGGVTFSSDTFRKFLEKGGSFAAVNAYLLAAQTPEILALPAEEREDAILRAVANNIGPSMIGFLHRGEMSRSLAAIGKDIAPDLQKFLNEFRGRPRTSAPAAEAAPAEPGKGTTALLPPTAPTPPPAAAGKPTPLLPPGGVPPVPAAPVPAVPAPAALAAPTPAAPVAPTAPAPETITPEAIGKLATGAKVQYDGTMGTAATGFRHQFSFVDPTAEPGKPNRITFSLPENKLTASELEAARKQALIKARVAEGIPEETISITINTDPAVPGFGYIQVDEFHPKAGNVFSSNPETLKAAGMDIPSSAELKKLPNGKYTLSEARKKLAELAKPTAAPLSRETLAEPIPMPKDLDTAKPEELKQEAAKRQERLDLISRERELIAERLKTAEGDEFSELAARKAELVEAERKFTEELKTLEGSLGVQRWRLEYQPYVGAGAIPVPAGTQKVTGTVLKTQKENLLEQVNAAIQQAPETGKEKITFDVPGDGSFTITNNKDSLKRFRDHATEEFPETIGKLKEPKLPSGRAKNPPKVAEPTAETMPKIISDSLSTDESRFVLQYGYADGTQIIGTDGRQLMRLVSDQAPGKPDAPVRIDAKGKVLSRDHKSYEWHYPNFSQVIPTDPTLVLGGMDTGQLFHVARQAEVFSKTSPNEKAKSAPLAIYVNPDGSIGGHMEIYGDEFTHNIQKGASHIGNYNPDYILNGMEAARRMGNERVDVYVDGEMGPVVFQGKNFLHVLMPMRGEKGVRDKPVTVGRALYPKLPASLPPIENPEAPRSAVANVPDDGKFDITLAAGKIHIEKQAHVGVIKVGNDLSLVKWSKADRSGREAMVSAELAKMSADDMLKKKVGQAAISITDQINRLEKERQEIIDEGKKRMGQPVAPAPPPPPAAPPAPSPAPTPAPTPAPAPAAPTPTAGAAPKPGKIIPGPTPEAIDKIRQRLKKRLAEKPKPEETAEDMELADLVMESAGPEADMEVVLDTILESKIPEANSGIFNDAVQMGIYHIKTGLHQFEPWAAQMRSEFGEAIEPYLKSVYVTARNVIESPGGESGGAERPPGLDPECDPPDRRVKLIRAEFTHPVDEAVVPAELLPNLDPHQKQDGAKAITSLRDIGGHLNSSGTGTGKTRVGLAAAHYWAMHGDRVIIVAPKMVFDPDWKKKTFGGSYLTDSQAMKVALKLVRGEGVGRLGRGEIGITTYENVAAVAHAADPNTVLIFDESHYLKNDSARGRAGDRASAKAKAVLYMSATPADKPEHIYYLTRIGILEGKTTSEQLRDLGMVLVEFKYRDANGREGTKQKWVPNQNISDAERNQRFNALFDRMTEKSAMVKRELSMKGCKVRVLKVALPPEAHAWQKEIVRFFGADTIDDLAGLNKAVCMMHMRRHQEPFKIAPTVMLVQRELEAGRQVMVFVSRVNESAVGRWVKDPTTGEKIRLHLTSSEATVKALRDALHEAGIHDIAEIHGEADQASLEALATFNEGKKRVCLATIESGGAGINADDRVGNRPRTMIVMTWPFDAVGAVQAAGRIWRAKTLSGAHIYFLLGDTDIDAWNADILGSKFHLLGAVVEGAIRDLNISDPDRVGSDNFHGKGGKTPPPVAGGMPSLNWEPYTAKSGAPMFRAKATPAFWTWWKTGGKAQARALGLATLPDRQTKQWYVWAKQIPESKPAPEPPPATEASVGPGGETGIIYSIHGTNSGLPKGIPDGGPNFPRELLEGSRRLETVVRSRATLRPGVLGQYVRSAISRADKIEVGNISNQATVAHEMGHDIDELIFGAHGLKYSQESLVQRIGRGDKKVLFKELFQISEFMRGPIGVGSTGHQRYRKRAAELIADWFSLYIHAPNIARLRAPEWTAGFEDVLARFPEAAETVRQLHFRNVIPVSPGRTAPPTGTPAGMPGAVLPRPAAPKVPREIAAARAAEALVPESLHKFNAEVQDARIRAENWRQDVPSERDRNDVGAFVEGIGNLEIRGDTRDAVIARMTPAKNTLAKDYRFWVEKVREKINRYLLELDKGEYLKWLEDYLPHFYVNARTAAGKAALGRLIKSSPNAKQRQLPTFREAVESGLIPITQDPTKLYEIYATINWRVATNLHFLNQMKSVRTSAGEPVIVPASQNPGGWPVSNSPMIQKVYARRGSRGEIMLWRGGAAVHPDVWPAVRQMTETPTRTALGRWFDVVNAITRANAFAFSFFHDLTLRSAAAGGMGALENPIRGAVRIFEHDPTTGELKVLQDPRAIGKKMMRMPEAVADAALHGLVFSWTESETYQHAARDALDRIAAWARTVPVVGKSARILRDLQHYRQEGLWRDTHDALKLMTYHDLVAKALATAPAGSDPKAIKERIAALLNDCFGGQEWQTQFWLDPTVRMCCARFLLAPDWTISTLRSVPFMSDAFAVVRGQAGRLTGRGPEPTRLNGWKGNIGRGKFWTAEIAALALATIAVQWAIWRIFGEKEKGDRAFPWENETGQTRRIDATPLMRNMPWRTKQDPTRYYVNLGKRPEEILHWFTQPFANIQAKLSRPINEIIRQVWGVEGGDFRAPWMMEHLSFVESLPQRSWSLATELFVPFTFSGNQFGLSLPYRKGMTNWKAVRAYESAYELIAEPSRLRSFLRGSGATADMGSVLRQITDAAERNGVNSRDAEMSARGNVRGQHYQLYFKAWSQGDEKAIEREADALWRLGVTPAMIQENIQSRIKRRPELLTQ